MKKILTLLLLKKILALLLFLFPSYALAVDNYAATEGVGKTFRCIENGGICYPGFTPFSATGTSLFTNTVPGVVTLSASSVSITGTVAATQSGTWNIGTLTTLTTITNPVTVTGTVTISPTTLAVTQSTSPWIIAGGGTAGSAATGVVTVQGIASGTVVPVSLTSTTITGNVAVTQASGSVASGAYSSGAYASGSIASGAYASGSIASGALASGSIAAGAMVDLLTMRQTVAAGTVAANSLLVGGIYNSSPITLTNGQGSAAQFDVNGYLKVNVASATGVAQGSTTSGQTVSPIGCRTLTSAPTDTTAQTNMPSCTTSGALRVDLNIAGTASVSGSGTATGALRVELPTNGTGVIAAVTAITNALPAGTNTIGGVNEVPATSGGLSNYFVQPTASDNHVVIKAGAGQVYHMSVMNNSATVNYLRLYNATTGFNGCNSATNLVGQWQIPGNTAVGGYTVNFPGGLAFATGISICVTSAYATTDTTNATASAMSVNVGYK